MGSNGSNPTGVNNLSGQANWFYAVGGYSFYGNGVASCKNGAFTLDFTYHIDDQYNWDRGKQVVIQGKTVKDVTLGRLHLVGLAREFHMVGTVQKTVAWNKGDRFDTTTGELNGGGGGGNPGRGGGR